MSNDLNKGFEKLIRNKIEDYNTPVDSNNWEAIEKSLRLSKRLRRLYTTAAAIIAAAAIVLFLVILYSPDDNKTQKQPTLVLQDSTPVATQADKQTVVIPDSNRQTTRETAAANRQTTENNTVHEQPATNLAPIYRANTIAAQTGKPDIYPENPPVKDKLKIAPQTVSGTPISVLSSNKLQSPAKIPPFGVEGIQNLDKTNKNKTTPDNKKDEIDKNGLNSRKWSVSMSFGAGNYQAPNMNNKNSDIIMAAPLLTSGYSGNYIRNKYRDKMKVPDNADVRHMLPLSTKFIVRRNLNSQWAIESGLSYAFLSTRYKWNNNIVNQQLHYLGIPLNAVYYLVSKPSWDIYASAGGMVEKGIHIHIGRNDNIVAKTDMDGLQWSVNSAIGATYKIREGWGVFFEPQFGYFFDNEQPESIRTEWPVSFGFGAGLRFSF
jgi:hypothetical protein